MRQITFYAILYVTALGIVVDLPLACGQSPRISQFTPRNYDKLKQPSVKAEPGPVIPGLRQNAIPQGITFAPSEKRLLLSHYFENAAACISVIDVSTGGMTSCVTLQDPTGQEHRGHAGGIAVLGDSLFVASDSNVFQYRLGDFLSPRPASAVPATTVHKCETKASFCTATPDLLLVGEFAYGKKYRNRSRVSSGFS